MLEFLIDATKNFQNLVVHAVFSSLSTMHSSILPYDYAITSFFMKVYNWFPPTSLFNLLISQEKNLYPKVPSCQWNQISILLIRNHILTFWSHSAMLGAISFLAKLRAIS